MGGRDGELEFKGFRLRLDEGMVCSHFVLNKEISSFLEEHSGEVCVIHMHLHGSALRLRCDYRL